MPAVLDIDQRLDRLELGPEILESGIVFVGQLLDEFVELNLGRSDLLANDAGTLLQVASDIAHCFAPALAWDDLAQTAKSRGGSLRGHIVRVRL
jgi:hypothetical protein